MKVKECMCNEVFCINSENKVIDAVKIMNEKHVGSVPVCDKNNEVIGLVTDRDIVLRVIACDKDAKQTSVSEIMTSNVACCTAEDDITNAQNKMSDSQIRRLPVVENGKIVGILTIGDILNNNTINANQCGEMLEKICCTKSHKNAE